MRTRSKMIVPLWLFVLLAIPCWALAQEAAPPPAEAAPAAEATAAEGPSAGDVLFTTNNLWMMIAAALVFIMHLGFATVETGLTRSKNTVNILFKNTMIPCIGILTYALVGFNLMYPGSDYAGKWFGFAGLGVGVGATEADIAANLTSAYNVGYTYWTDFLFQAMFAATAATIVSGAVAERVKLGPFLFFSTIFVAISYPITGMWKWGNGWLNTMETPFYDFAGSTLVHSVGGWGALVGAIIVGPRLKKFGPNGKINAIPGHSMPLATIGVFLLWLGWFGFNGGSVLSADPALVSLTLVTTCLAASAGAAGAMFTSWTLMRKPDLSMVLNGILAGLVGITAGADQMAAGSATLIGLISGGLVVCSVLFFDRIRIDDPVGAISVHLVCGIFGTLAVGLFGAKAGMPQLASQLIGIAAIGAFTVVFAAVLWLALKVTVGIRVSDEEQVAGLDLGEHNQESYPDFLQSPSKLEMS
jgi:ammonium transporter, Amt family